MLRRDVHVYLSPATAIIRLRNGPSVAVDVIFTTVGRLGDRSPSSMNLYRSLVPIENS